MFDELDKINKMSSFYFERFKVIQGNIANVNTPFYKPKDLTFEELFQNYTQMKLTDPRHINPYGKEDIVIKPLENGFLTGYDQNKVNLEEEMAKLAETSIMYKTLVEIMKKKLAGMKYAISGK
ncbi:MAG: flagellar basal body rod protein FlgB [Sulfurihydrogenibium sp.]|uniref:flagellar basal body rod protein FlgB n=1 Tax=Sulfurihydrogenibium sp. TaxID=2053621 RepID=UPI000CBB7130|nr:MAG: flagellar basal body rod protein FlgB [Sulfurihydrogenibium sp.]